MVKGQHKKPKQKTVQKPEVIAAEKPQEPAVRSFLYVGGRDCQVAHLRQVASDYGAELHHHDGGLRESISRIDHVLPSVDCVFCPIDCISHEACLRVKSGCKKHGKSFVPLRNGSKSSLERALEEMNVKVMRV